MATNKIASTEQWTSLASTLNGKQEKLLPGEGITIDADGKTIKADITALTSALSLTTYALKTELPSFATVDEAGIVKPDGTTITVDDTGTLSAIVDIDTASFATKTDIEDMLTKTEAAADYAKKTELTDYAKKSDLTDVYKYKGTVANEAALKDLEESATEGDVYNTTDTGDNFAWTGTEWDKLGGTVDLSGYATTTDLTNGLKDKLSKTDADASYAAKDAIPEIATVDEAGIVKPDGTSIAIDLEGTITAKQPEIATDEQVGLVKPDDSTITITEEGVISAAIPDTSTLATKEELTQYAKKEEAATKAELADYVKQADLATFSDEEWAGFGFVSLEEE